MKMNTQNAQILSHLKSGKPITQLEAWKQYNCFRLSGRIYDLKREGHPIESEMITDNGKRFKRYWLAA